MEKIDNHKMHKEEWEQLSKSSRLIITPVLHKLKVDKKKFIVESMLYDNLYLSGMLQMKYNNCFACREAKFKSKKDEDYCHYCPIKWNPADKKRRMFACLAEVSCYSKWLKEESCETSAILAKEISELKWT